MTTQARKRAHLEFQVTLLAERETTLVLRMLKELSETSGSPSATVRDLEALLKETDVGTRVDVDDRCRMEFRDLAERFSGVAWLDPFFTMWYKSDCSRESAPTDAPPSPQLM